jgi:hypothetical protein
VRGARGFNDFGVALRQAVVSVNAAMPQAVKASVSTPVRRYFGDGRDFDPVVSNLQVNCRPVDLDG